MAVPVESAGPVGKLFRMRVGGPESSQSSALQGLWGSGSSHDSDLVEILPRGACLLRGWGLCSGPWEWWAQWAPQGALEDT